MRRKVFQSLLAVILLGATINTNGFIPTAKAANTDDYITLNIPWEHVEQCGNQKNSGQSTACQAYAWAYCRIILDNKLHNWNEYWLSTKGEATAPGKAGYNLVTNNVSEQTVLQAIYQNITSGRPVVLRATGAKGYSFHYVVAVGYLNGCNPQNLSQGDIMVLDPWDGSLKNLTAVQLKKNLSGQYGYWTVKADGVPINANVKPNVSNFITITFDPNGGYVSSASKTLTAGTLLTGMPIPARSGYTFVGWAMDKIDPDSATTQATTIVAEGIFTFDKDTTLYALWKRETSVPPPKG